MKTGEKGKGVIEMAKGKMEECKTDGMMVVVEFKKQL